MAFQWNATEVTETVTESAPQAGERGQTFQETDPRVIWHVQVRRVDGGSTNAVLVEIHSTTDEARTLADRWDDLPLTGRTIPVGRLQESFVITGVYAFSVFVRSNGATDTASCVVHVRRSEEV